MENIGVGIIGCGAIFGVHADAIANNPSVKLIAVADIMEEKAKTAAERYQCTYYTDYKEILGDSRINAIHICTPHYLHAPMAIEALNVGKHVMVEKPVALNVKQAWEMVEAARKNKKLLGVAFQNRFNNTSVKMKEILCEGRLGQIKGMKGLVTWHRDEPYYTQSGWRGKFATEGGGVLINQAIHTLDLMQWLAGEVEAIKGHVDTRVLDNVIEVEDTADATIYFKNGAVGLFYATNGYTTNSSVELEVHCEKGVLNIKDGNLTLTAGKKTEHITDDHHNGKYKAYWGDSHKKLIDRFYHCIFNKDEKGYVAGEEGITALQMIECIYRSSAQNEKCCFEG